MKVLSWSNVSFTLLAERITNWKFSMKIPLKSTPVYPFSFTVITSVQVSIDSVPFVCLTVHFFYKQPGSDSNHQSCLYFQDFQGSKLLNVCLVVCTIKQSWTLFQWIFSIRHWHTVYTVSHRSKQLLVLVA